MPEEIKQKIKSSEKVCKKLDRYEKKLNGQLSQEGQEGQDGQNGKDGYENETDTEDENNESNESSLDQDSSFRTENTEKEPLTSLELNTDLFLEKLKMFDQKMYNSEGCLCHCHKPAQVENGTQTSTFLSADSSCSTVSIQTSTETETNNNSLDVVYEKQCHTNGYPNGDLAKHVSVRKCDLSTQTLSTGDIVITKVYFNEGVAN